MNIYVSKASISFQLISFGGDLNVWEFALIV